MNERARVPWVFNKKKKNVDRGSIEVSVRGANRLANSRAILVLLLALTKIIDMFGSKKYLYKIE